VIEELRQRGIGTSVHFIPLHLHPYYQRTWGYRLGNSLSPKITLIAAYPSIYPSMTDEDINHVIEALQDISIKFRR